ncbi:MAG: hypothetical protein U0103_04565 [Candidatus Obscuribacterales bacterium]
MLRANRLFGAFFASVAAFMSLAFGCQIPCNAEFDSKLDDPYFQEECQWAMFVEMKDDRPFLKYPGSQLNPLTVFKISARTFPQDADGESISSPSRLYEEFWYHGNVPIGLKRYSQLKIAPYQYGVVVLAPSGSNNAAAANLIVRLLLELELQRAAMAVVMVPMEKYDQIASELGHYSFFPGLQVRKGFQTGIRLTSYPFGKDRLYYLNPAR